MIWLICLIVVILLLWVWNTRSQPFEDWRVADPSRLQVSRPRIFGAAATPKPVAAVDAAEVSHKEATKSTPISVYQPEYVGGGFGGSAPVIYTKYGLPTVIVGQPQLTPQPQSQPPPPPPQPILQLPAGVTSFEYHSNTSVKNNTQTDDNAGGNNPISQPHDVRAVEISRTIDVPAGSRVDHSESMRGGYTVPTPDGAYLRNIIIDQPGNTTVTTTLRASGGIAGTISA